MPEVSIADIQFALLFQRNERLPPEARVTLAELASGRGTTPLGANRILSRVNKAHPEGLTDAVLEKYAEVRCVHHPDLAILNGRCVRCDAEAFKDGKSKLKKPDTKKQKVRAPLLPSSPEKTLAPLPDGRKLDWLDQLWDVTLDPYARRTSAPNKRKRRRRSTAVVDPAS